jgi:hypothetical protein
MEGSRLASEQMALLEAIGDPALTVGLSFVAFANWFNSGEFGEILRWSQTAIELADGDAVLGAGFGVGSPLAMAITFRGIARFWLGMPGWRQDFDDAVAVVRDFDPNALALVVGWIFISVLYGGVRPDASFLGPFEEAMRRAEEFGNDWVRAASHLALGMALLYRDNEADKGRGIELLTLVRDVELPKHAPSLIPVVRVWISRETAKHGNSDEAISEMRDASGELHAAQRVGWEVCSVVPFVETLLERGGEDDVAEAENEIEKLANIGNQDGSAVIDITLLQLRALAARARGDDGAYRDLLCRYRNMATSLGFEGHMALAKAMPA